MKKLYIITSIIACASISMSAAIDKKLSEIAGNVKPVTCTVSSTESLDAKQVNREFIRKANPSDVTISTAERSTLAAIDGGGSDRNWESLGNAKLTDDCITSVYDVPNLTYEVEIQKNKKTEGLYRLVNPYGEAYPYNEPGDYDTVSNHYMVIHAEDPNNVYIDLHESGCDWGNGEILIWSMAGNELSQGKSIEDVNQYTGKLIDGNITFPANSLLIALKGYNNNKFYPANSNGKFNISLPGGKDYSHDFANTSCGNDDKVRFKFAVGADIAKVYMTILPLDMGFTMELYEKVFANAESFGLSPIPAEYAGKTLTITVPYEGPCTMVLVYTNADDQVVGGDYGFLFGNYASLGEWKSLGKVPYTEDILASLYNGFDVTTYDVAIEENVKYPGLYRLVDPYVAHPVIVEKELGDHGEDHTHYIYIDAIDPAKVSLIESPIGVELDGTIFIAHIIDFVKEENITDDMYGTLEGGIIKFPAKSIYARIGNSDSWYYANSNTSEDSSFGSFSIDLRAAGVESVISESSNAPVEYFNLQGIRIDNPTSGLLISRQGNKTTKIVIR